MSSSDAGNTVKGATDYASSMVQRHMSEKEGVYGDLTPNLGRRLAPGIQKSGLSPHGTDRSGEPP